MDASDLIRSMQRQSSKEGAVHIWGPDADRHATLLIHLVVEGAPLSDYLHPCGMPGITTAQGPSVVERLWMCPSTQYRKPEARRSTVLHGA
jgi:hypothetical protein